VGFNAARFARASLFILVALAVGFLGSLYVGAKFFEPTSGTAKRDLRAAQPRPPERDASSRVPGSNDVSTPPPVPPQTAESKGSAPAPNAARTEQGDPGLQKSGREKPVANTRDELRLGQQERRRLRAERRKALDDANASVPRRPRQQPREILREETPFFPFRRF
jgi:hypothetical protein